MPFVQTVRCSCEKNKRVDREMTILLCEVPLNKDREIEGEKERQQQLAVELLVHSTHTKSIYVRR